MQENLRYVSAYGGRVENNVVVEKGEPKPAGFSFVFYELFSLQLFVSRQQSAALS